MKVVSLFITTTISVAALNFTAPASWADNTACFAGQPNCLSRDNVLASISKVQNTAAIDGQPNIPVPPDDDPMPPDMPPIGTIVDTYGNHAVLDPTLPTEVGAAQATDWDGDGDWDVWTGAIAGGNDHIFVDENNDGEMDEVDLDGDGNIDLGPDGDGTVFHFQWPGTPDGIDGFWMSWDPMTGDNATAIGFGMSIADPAPAMAPIETNKNVSNASGALAALNDDGTNHGGVDDTDANTQTVRNDQASAEQASAPEQAQTQISGPRPRCPEGYGEGGEDNSGSGRPGRQSDGGGNRN